MKNYIPTIITLAATLAVSSNLSAQSATEIFTGSGGDGLWSNDANWSVSGSGGGTAPTADPAAIIQLNASPIVDGNYTVKMIGNNYGGVDYTVSGTGNLTLDSNNAVPATVIRNVSGTDGNNLIFHLS